MLDLIILLFGVISYYLDSTRKICNSSNSILLIHHMANIFANFGWISNSRVVLEIYLVVPIIVFIHWKTNNNKCILTEWHNKNCGEDLNKPFNDFFNILNLIK